MPNLVWFLGELKNTHWITDLLVSLGYASLETKNEEIKMDEIDVDKILISFCPNYLLLGRHY